MRLAAFNGSSRKNGNTRILLEIICDETRRAGIDSEIISLSDFSLRGCLGCFACKGQARCITIDDGFNDCFAKMREADGIVLGSPVYSADVSAPMKAFLERAGVVCASNPGLLRRKAGAAVAAVRRAGGLNTVDSMNHFLLNKEVILAGSTYWNMVYGKEPGDVRRDEEGMRNMQTLGENLAWLRRRL